MFLRSAFAYIFVSSCLVAVSARNPPKVFIIRHGEKPPNPDDHGLTLDGIKRSQCLRDVFGKDSSYDIGHIMAPTVKWSESYDTHYDQKATWRWINTIWKDGLTDPVLIHRWWAPAGVYDRPPPRQWPRSWNRRPLLTQRYPMRCWYDSIIRRPWKYLDCLAT